MIHNSSARAGAQSRSLSLVVFSHPFPYDVSFDAWSTLILKNQILQRYTRSQDLIDRERGTLSLDRPSQHEADGGFSLYHLLADESGESAFEHIEVQERLLQAIARLRSRAQQQVISIRSSMSCAMTRSRDI